MKPTQQQRLQKKKQQAVRDKNEAKIITYTTDLADYFAKHELYQKAADEYIQLADIHKAKERHMEYGLANRAIGEMFIALNQFAAAIPYLQIHLDMAKQERNKTEEQRALATIGLAYFNWYVALLPENDLSKLNKSLKVYTESLKVCESLKGIRKHEAADMKSRLFANLGLVQEFLGDHNAAIELFNKSISLAKENDLYEQLYRSYISKGSLHSKLKNYNESILNFNFATETAKKIKSQPDLQCAALLAKSEILISLSDYHGAKHALHKAYKLKSPNKDDAEKIEQNLRCVAALCRVEDRLVVVSSDNYLKWSQEFELMGDLASRLGNYEKAIEYYKQCEAAADKCRDQITARKMAGIYYSIGESCKDDNQYSVAIEYFRKELSCEADYNWITRLTTLTRIAECEELADLPAERTYMEAVQLCQANINPKEEIRMLRSLVEYLKRKGLQASIYKGQLAELTANYVCEPQSDSQLSEPDSDIDAVQAILEEINLDQLSDCTDDSDDEPLTSVRNRTKQFRVTRLGETPLHIACINGQLKVVRHLLDQGHKLNVRDFCGWTPMHEACNHGHLDIIKLLLERGAFINDRGGVSCGGVSPLLDSAWNGHLDVVKLLLDNGALVSIKDDEGNTPLQALRSWCELKKPTGNDLAEYKSLYERMKQTLIQTGHEPNESPIVISARSGLIDTDKENVEGRSLRVQPLGLRKRTTRAISRNVVCDLNETRSIRERGSEAAEYRQAISSLRNKQPVAGSSRQVSPPMRSRPALVPQEDIDDFFEDDVGANQAKRRKINATPRLARERPTQETVTEMEDDSDGSSIVNLEDFHPELLSTPNEPRTQTNGNSKRKSQTSLFDAGFSAYRNPKRSSDPIIRPTSSSQRQARLPFQRRSREAEESRVQTVQSPVEMPTVQATTIGSNNSVLEVDPMLHVDIRIEGRLYRVPVLKSQLQTHSIKWIAEEAANRYARKECMKPVLELETNSGAILADDDLIMLVFAPGGMEAEPIEARVIRWNIPPLITRYKETCAQMSKQTEKRLETLVEEMSTTLNLNNCAFQGPELAPLCKAISHQSTLLLLNLSGNYLTDECIQLLANSLNTLENLSALDLSCTTLSMQHVKTLAAGVNSTKVTDLNLSDNPIFNESLPYLVQLLNKFKLHTLKLSNCNLTPFGQSYALNLREIECLDASDNKLDVKSVEQLLHSTDLSRLRNLNVARNPLANSSAILNLLGASADKLEVLDLAKCDIKDSEISQLLEYQKARSLHTINLSHNSKLTGLTLRRLLECSQLTKLNLISCDSIYKYFDINIEYFRILMEKNRQIELKIYADWSSESNAEQLLQLFVEAYPSVSFEKSPRCLRLTIDSSNILV